MGTNIPKMVRSVKNRNEIKSTHLWFQLVLIPCLVPCFPPVQYHFHEARCLSAPNVKDTTYLIPHHSLGETLGVVLAVKHIGEMIKIGVLLNSNFRIHMVGVGVG